METTKFVNKEMATIAAQVAFYYLFLNYRHVSISAWDIAKRIEIDVFPNDDEEVKLPDGYMKSFEREEWIASRYPDESAFKVKKFFFYF